MIERIIYYFLEGIKSFGILYDLDFIAFLIALLLWILILGIGLSLINAIFKIILKNDKTKIQKT